MFKDRRRRAGEDFLDKPHYHGLVDEAEAEMHTLSWPELMAAGGVAGVVAWVITFPFDVFKTRMQSAAMWEECRRRGVQPPGLWEIARQSIRQEGWGVMVAGLWPTIVR
jgi:solute carrier family 25 carnitine/acylcarnitine transporter 20/29